MIISSKDRFGTWCTPSLSRQYLMSPLGPTFSITTVSLGLPRARTRSISYCGGISKAFRSPSFSIEAIIQPPKPFSVAPSIILWAAIPWSHPKDCSISLSPRIMMYADGLSSSQRPDQSVRYPAQARCGNISEFL